MLVWVQFVLDESLFLYTISFVCIYAIVFEILSQLIPIVY